MAFKSVLSEIPKTLKVNGKTKTLVEAANEMPKTKSKSKSNPLSSAMSSVNTALKKPMTVANNAAKNATNPTSIASAPVAVHSVMGGILGDTVSQKLGDLVAAPSNAIPTLGSALSPSGGLADAYQAKLGTYDTKALDALKSRAMGEGQSPWLKMQLEKQGLEDVAARDRAAQEALGGAAMAQSQLAMRGGLGSGARERIARDMSRNVGLAQQGISRAGQQNRLGLNLADEQIRTELLSKIPGMDLQLGNVQTQNNQFNATNTLGALGAENAGKMGIYGEQMKGYAADKTGAAIQNAGKK